MMAVERPAADRSRTRRRVLAIAGAVAISVTTGCLNDPSEGDPAPTADGSSGDDSGTDPPYNAAVASVDDHPVTEPVEYEDGQRCPVCNMQPPDYPRWNCQLAHDDGTGLFFDSPGCLLAYHEITEAHPTDAPIERIWFTDLETRESFDAADGFLVRETGYDGLSNPMSGSPIPYATRERAIAYVDEADHLDESSIITVEDVDLELAEFYRGDRMGFR